MRNLTFLIKGKNIILSGGNCVRCATIWSPHMRILAQGTSSDDHYTASLWQRICFARSNPERAAASKPGFKLEQKSPP